MTNYKNAALALMGKMPDDSLCLGAQGKDFQHFNITIDSFPVE